MEVDLHYMVRMFLALLQDNFNNLQVLIWLNNDPRYSVLFLLIYTGTYKI